MLSSADIIEMQRDAAAAAAQAKQEPLMVWPQDVGDLNAIRAMPFLGDYLPAGWERVDPDTIKPNRTRHSANTVDGVPSLWVDASGFGGPGELAMTIQEFVDWIVPNYGYAITVSGQFQIGVGVFRRVR